MLSPHSGVPHLLTGNVSEDSVLLQGAGNWEISRRMNHTSKCYTEIYDKSDLVMLSPDAPLYMEGYDPQKIYIIGGERMMS